MDPAVEPWVQLWDYLDGNFWSVWHWSAQQLGAEEVGWQPIPEVASVGWNLEHLAEMLDYYLAHIFGQGTPRSSLVTMRSGSRDDGRFHDLRAIAAYHREVRPRYRWGHLAFRFVRSVGKRTPSAYATSWAIEYNVAGSLLTSAGGVRETLFHELFHNNDEDHGGYARYPPAFEPVSKWRQ